MMNGHKHEILKQIKFYDFDNTSPYMKDFERAFASGLYELTHYKLYGFVKQLKKYSIPFASIFGFLILVNLRFFQKHSIEYQLVHTSTLGFMIALLLTFLILYLDKKWLDRGVRAYVNHSWKDDLANINDVYQLKGGRFWCAVYEPNPETKTFVGTIALECKNSKEGIYELRRCTVSEHFRRYGIGRMLCEHLIKEARTLNGKKIILSTSSYQMAAICLYQTLGWKIGKKEWITGLLSSVSMELCL